MRRTMWGLLVVPCLAWTACTQNSSSSSSGGADRGSLNAVVRGNFLDVELDADTAPLSLAATVTVEGSQVAGEAQLGAAAQARDLFKQRATGSNAMRFVVSDSRALRIARSGVVVRIPLTSPPGRVQVSEVSASDEQGHNLPLRAFAGVPESRP